MITLFGKGLQPKHHQQLVWGIPEWPDMSWLHLMSSSPDRSSDSKRDRHRCTRWTGGALKPKSPWNSQAGWLAIQSWELQQVDLGLGFCMVCRHKELGLAICWNYVWAVYGICWTNSWSVRWTWDVGAIAAAATVMTTARHEKRCLHSLGPPTPRKSTEPQLV